MLRKIVDSKFLSAASLYLLAVVVVILFPFLFIIKIMYNVFRGRRKESSMRGKVVLITGASSGIGESVAYEYAKRGAFLAIVARREDRLRKVAQKARKLGSPDVIVISADVSNSDNCRKFVDQTINHFGRLDHLVNNAGFANVYSIQKRVEITKFAPVMDTNFWGSIYPTYFAIPHLKKTKGKIVVNASAAGYISVHSLAFYCASKSALVSFYESIRVELAPEITLSLVTLGFVETDMLHGRVMNRDGVMQDKHEIPKVISSMMISLELAAKAIVNGACRGDRYIVEPRPYLVTMTINFFFPEFTQWLFSIAFNKEVNKRL